MLFTILLFLRRGRNSQRTHLPDGLRSLGFHVFDLLEGGLVQTPGKVAPMIGHGLVVKLGNARQQKPPVATCRSPRYRTGIEPDHGSAQSQKLEDGRKPRPPQPYHAHFGLEFAFQAGQSQPVPIVPNGCFHVSSIRR